MLGIEKKFNLYVAERINSPRYLILSRKSYIGLQKSIGLQMVDNFLGGKYWGMDIAIKENEESFFIDVAG